MKYLALALVMLVAFITPSQREGEWGGLRSRTTLPTSTDLEDHGLLPASLSPRFTTVDIFIDSASSPLAAYQVDFTAASTKIVGVEGGDPGPFRAAPYYDERAMQHERVVIGALSTLPHDQLPRGRSRVARVHLMTTGDADPACTLTLTTAAGSGAARIDATASWAVPTHADAGLIERK
jgi:hypothetical protein